MKKNMVCLTIILLTVILITPVWGAEQSTPRTVGAAAEKTTIQNKDMLPGVQNQDRWGMGTTKPIRDFMVEKVWISEQQEYGAPTFSVLHAGKHYVFICMMGFRGSTEKKDQSPGNCPSGQASSYALLEIDNMFILSRTVCLSDNLFGFIGSPSETLPPAAMRLGSHQLKCSVPINSPRGNFDDANPGNNEKSMTYSVVP